MVNIAKEFWQESRALTSSALILLVGFVLSLAGLAIDRRTISGMHAWMKPAKFAISSAIFALSICWLFRYIDSAPRMKRLLGPALAFILLLEVALIDVQAARGTTSHFNVSTTVNSLIFGVMGTAIFLLLLGTIWILVALCRQRFADEAWGWALRLGMAISVLGSVSAGLMVSPTPSQVETIARHARPTTIGAHTVGAPDGGPGLPAVGWSKKHGDLRIPHFFGMHALQLVPFVFWWLRRRFVPHGRRATTLAFTLAASYFVLTALLTWQALRGESIAEPAAVTAMALSLWTLGSIAALVFCLAPVRYGARTGASA